MIKKFFFTDFSNTCCIFSIFGRFILPHLAAAVLDKFVAKLKVNVSEIRERKKKHTKSFELNLLGENLFKLAGI